MKLVDKLRKADLSISAISAFIAFIAFSITLLSDYTLINEWWFKFAIAGVTLAMVIIKGMTGIYQVKVSTKFEPKKLGDEDAKSPVKMIGNKRSKTRRKPSD